MAKRTSELYYSDGIDPNLRSKKFSLAQKITYLEKEDPIRKPIKEERKFSITNKDHIKDP